MKSITGILYRNILKPILFLFPADNVHEWFLMIGRLLGKSRFDKYFVKKLWSYENPMLEQNLLGLNFNNPIGLAAGFDYNADLVEILPSVGFGFHTVGTITNESYGGNPPPMLARLPKSRSLLVNKGFKNDGIKNVLNKLKINKTTSLRGVSIGATNKAYTNFASMVEDIVAGFKTAENFKDFDYYELNISCPNLQNVQNLDIKIDSPLGLGQLLRVLESEHINRPVFIKMPLERRLEDIKAIVDTALPFRFIQGLVLSNLAKDRTNPALYEEELNGLGLGNFSGKPVEDTSNEVLNFVYKTYQKRFILVGVGGVFTAEDAYKKIKLGASLIQLITGLIYMGPQQIGVMNEELVELLKKDGFKNISEAVGANH
ncbi:MAG: quinone-dependent dihydroorotate dehydrogenase [Minisyncoccia bacterium]